MNLPGRIVVIGGSKGGIKALQVLFPDIHPSFPHPFVVVLHRIPYEGDRLTGLIQRYCHIPVVEPDDKDPVVVGKVYMAPADYHLLLEDGYFHLSIDEPVNYSRPSIDVLFESAADTYESGVTAILLTGANDDGTKGLAAIKHKGGVTLVQNPETAEAQAMPRSAIAAGVADQVLSLQLIADYLNVIGR